MTVPMTTADLKVGDTFTMPEQGFGKTWKLTKSDWAVSLDGEMSTAISGIERVIPKFKLKLKFMPISPDTYLVALDDDDPTTQVIAELAWAGGQWHFAYCDRDGERTGTFRSLDVDPAHRLHLNAVHEENVKGRLDRNEAVNEALDAALATMRRQFRDESRDLAKLGARMFARVWYPKWRDL